MQPTAEEEANLIDTFRTTLEPFTIRMLFDLVNDMPVRFFGNQFEDRWSSERGPARYRDRSHFWPVAACNHQLQLIIYQNVRPSLPSKHEDAHDWRLTLGAY